MPVKQHYLSWKNTTCTLLLLWIEFCFLTGVCMQYFSSTFGFLYSYEWKMLFLLYIIISYMRVQLIFKWLLVAELCRQIVQHEYSLTIGKKKKNKTYSEEGTDRSCTHKRAVPLTDTGCVSRRRLALGVILCQADLSVSGSCVRWPIKFLTSVTFTCGSCGDWCCQGGHLLDGTCGLGFSEGSEIFTYSFRDEKWRYWREASRFQ